MRKLTLLAAAVFAATAVSAVPAEAAVVQIQGPGTNGLFSGNECKDATGFSNCYATQTGTNDGGALASLAVFKLNSDGTLAFSTNYGSITGDEFNVNFDLDTHVLSFTYDPGAGDPTLHYFDVSQANSFALFYDANGLLSGQVDLDNYFGRQSGGFSHITFYDEQGPSVPEASTWAMMIFGFGAAGAVMRRGRRRKALLAQIA